MHDTGVVPAPVRNEPDPAVVASLDRQPAEAVATTAITVLEVRGGHAASPGGKRRRALQPVFGEVLDEDLGGLVSPVDRTAAERTATIRAVLRGRGRSIEGRDLPIAGAVAARDAASASRNLRDFEGTGLRFLDPRAAAPVRDPLSLAIGAGSLDAVSGRRSTQGDPWPSSRRP